MNQLFSVLFVLLFLSGCVGTTTAISKRNLAAENQMSATVFLEPVAEDQQTVYVQVKNTSGNAGLNLAEPIKTRLQSKGYRIVSDPKKAHYLLQANVLSVTEMNPQTRDDLMAAGFGGGLAGGAIGAGAGALLSGHSDAVIGGALAGAALGMLVDASIKDVTYGATADIQISERAPTGQFVSTRSKGELKQGTQTTVSVNTNTSSEWKRYQTRVVSTANKANLKLEQATPVLADGLSETIAGIFNSQLVSFKRQQMALIMPAECQNDPEVERVLKRIDGEFSPIRSYHYVDCSQSMANGGGPACLRLRIVATPKEMQAIHPRYLLTAEKIDALEACVKQHYRDRLTIKDFLDPAFREACARTLAALDAALT